MDVVSDALEYGRWLRCLTIMNDFTEGSVGLVIE
jgi:hypothetical protein